MNIVQDNETEEFTIKLSASEYAVLQKLVTIGYTNISGYVPAALGVLMQMYRAIVRADGWRPTWHDAFNHLRREGVHLSQEEK